MKQLPGTYPKYDAKTVTEYHKKNKSNKTGYLGVTHVKSRNTYRAYIRVHGSKEKLYCGQAKTAEEAARKYDIKARELYGPEAVTNFDDDGPTAMG